MLFLGDWSLEVQETEKRDAKVLEKSCVTLMIKINNVKYRAEVPAIPSGTQAREAVLLVRLQVSDQLGNRSRCFKSSAPVTPTETV